MECAHLAGVLDLHSGAGAQQGVEEQLVVLIAQQAGGRKDPGAIAGAGERDQAPGAVSLIAVFPALRCGDMR